jgi:hypothetical protein
MINHPVLSPCASRKAVQGDPELRAEGMQKGTGPCDNGVVSGYPVPVSERSSWEFSTTFGDDSGGRL